MTAPPLIPTSPALQPHYAHLSPEEATLREESMRLLRRTGAGALFADGEFHRERHFGLTKSFLANGSGSGGRH